MISALSTPKHTAQRSCIFLAPHLNASRDVVQPPDSGRQIGARQKADPESLGDGFPRPMPRPPVPLSSRFTKRVISVQLHAPRVQSAEVSSPAPDIPSVVQKVLSWGSDSHGSLHWCVTPTLPSRASPAAWRAVASAGACAPLLQTHGWRLGGSSPPMSVFQPTAHPSTAWWHPAPANLPCLGWGRQH